MFQKILVVCVGNICRSPFGEHALQHKIPNKTVSSAGIAVEKSRLVGKPADPTIVELAAKDAFDLSSHKSKQLTKELCIEYDLILVMEKGHIEAVSQISPESRGKTMLLGQWLPAEFISKEIPDPYRQSKEAFEHSYRLIDIAVSAWATKLG
ncbi:low molecular weight protein-tyrosine-phosphatase [Shewanella sp. 10N.286.45.A1]|uniref:low molecular weight protein-tyrosine-phosphatase n=1 Tax=Shewanella sp. 10N.286.45.A1 TaxID=3229694 RepID=UPI00354C3056